LLDQSIAQTTDMLVYDFSPAGRTDWTQKVKRETATVKGVSYAGRAVREGDDWVWVRAGNGIFASLQGYQPVDPNAATPVAAAATPVPKAVPATSVAAAAAAAPAVVTPADSSASAAAAAPAVATPAAITPDHTAPAAQDAGAGGK
jgi:hypothetical protein